MTRSPDIAARAHARRRGISLVETVIASLLVSMVLTATIALVAPVVRGSTHASDHLRAARLAAELIDEIRTRPFDDPDDDKDDIGTEDGEDPSDRVAFDDVDDYDGWSSSPPVSIDGTVLPGLDGWKRVARVDHAIGDNANTDSSRTGIKRIRVIVTRDGQRLIRMDAVVADDTLEDGEK